MNKGGRVSDGPLSALDFFAGSGLVRVGLGPEFRTVWANDNCRKKASVYSANFAGTEFVLDDIKNVRAENLPHADLAWASFPCQDLSLAGNMSGMERGTRSGLFWEWIRVLDVLSSNKRRPTVLCAENVVGFLSADGGNHFKAAYAALSSRGYRAGAIVVDARLFVPQSRPRAFLIAASAELPLEGLTQAVPSKPFHPLPVVRSSRLIGDPNWVWWSLPSWTDSVPRFSELCERDAPCDPPEKTKELLTMLSERNRAKLNAAIRTGGFLVGTGYKRTRSTGNARRSQRLELRFDGVAGCLRTPEGGSSRQIVLIVNRGKVLSRLMTVRECARLMGADDTFLLPGSYNDGYRAMGDAVAVPVTRFLAKHLLAPLASRNRAADAA